MKGKLIECVFHLAPVIIRQMHGWDCADPVERVQGDFRPILHEFLEPGEFSVTGREVIRRARQRGIKAGLLHAEAMFREQYKIPSFYRGNELIFPEAWRRPDGHWELFCLQWFHGRWELRFKWFGPGFYSSGRLVDAIRHQELTANRQLPGSFQVTRQLSSMHQKTLVDDWRPGHNYVAPKLSIADFPEPLPGDWSPGSR